MSISCAHNIVRIDHSADEKSKDKHKSSATKPSMRPGLNVDLTAASNALMNKGSGVNGSNLNGGRLTLNNNNNDSTQDKNRSLVRGSFGMADTSNGGGGGVSNNGQAIDNFANFDAFSSAKDLDLFASTDFPDAIGLNSTQIDGHKSIINKSASGAAKDRFLGSVNNTPTKRSTLINQIGNNDSFKGVNINDYFDAKFDSFVTTDSSNFAVTLKAADISNANSNTKSKTQQPFGLDDDDGFADFSNANVFKATTTNNNNDINARFESAFQPCNTTTKSVSSLGKPKPASDCDAIKTAAEKIPSKFQKDYSKTDQFDDDLEEVLKRSLVDQ